MIFDKKFAHLTFSKYFCKRNALVAELVDALDLGSSVSRREGSSPFRRTQQQS